MPMGKVANAFFSQRCSLMTGSRSAISVNDIEHSQTSRLELKSDATIASKTYVVQKPTLSNNSQERMGVRHITVDATYGNLCG